MVIITVRVLKWHGVFPSPYSTSEIVIKCMFIEPSCGTNEEFIIHS